MMSFQKGSLLKFEIDHKGDLVFFIQGTSHSECEKTSALLQKQISKISKIITLRFFSKNEIFFESRINSVEAPLFAEWEALVEQRG
jgi:acid phosphatase class B